jgi:6-pyruvoyltetrahydropterin/6-carboxytetrahydropterin synthase
MMYELKIITQFAAAHQIRGIEGGCERLHGHNWKVEVFVSGDKLDENGLLIDFRDIKDKTEALMEELDHKFLNELEPFITLNPSSENVSRYVYEALSRQLNTDTIRISKITVWESDSACASYTEP